MISIKSNLLDFHGIFTIGTSKIDDPEQLIRVITINRICFFATGSLMGLTPILCHYLAWRLDVLLPLVAEILINCSVFYLNYKLRYTSAAIALYFTQIIAIGYFGVLLGSLLELQLTIILLIAIAFLIFKAKRLRNFAVIGAFTDLALLEYIYFQSTPFAIWIIQCIIVSIITLITVVISKPYLAGFDLRFPLEKQNKELERKSAAKGEFIAQVSHELRTPLSVIIGAASLLDKEVKEQTIKVKNLISDLNTMGEHARQIISNVLKYSEIEQGILDKAILKPTNIYKCLSDTVNSMKTWAQSKNNMGIHFSTNDMPMFIETDSRLITQIAVNIIGNAIKYGDRDTIITVSINKINGAEWTLSISNVGDEIENEKIEYLHQMFTRNDNETVEGSGLGLYIVKRQVDLLNGFIEMKSSERITAYTITFPLIKAIGHIEQLTRNVTNIDFPHIDLRNLHLFIIEDNKFYSRVMEAVLENEIGCKTTFSLDCPIPELIMKIESAKPDIILIDCFLTSIEGPEVAKAIKSTNSIQHIPMATLSGTTQEHEPKVFMEMTKAGVEWSILKPIDTRQLQKTINEIFYKKSISC